MTRSWSLATIEFLRGTSTCPRCAAPIRVAGWCSSCGADLMGEHGAGVLAAARDAAEAIERRQALIDALPTVSAPAAAPSAVAAPAAVPSGAPPAATPTAAPAAAPPATVRTSVSLQSVLAVVGAALVAVAAIVFAFLNPELRDTGVRAAIVGAVTVLFLGAAWLMARARLQFSAEAVGALAGVFVALDIQAIGSRSPAGLDPWVAGGIATAAFGLVLVVLAVIRRIRTWLWLGVVALAVSPAMFGYADGSVPPSIGGHLGVLALALVLHEALVRVGPLSVVEPRVERATLTVLQLVVLPVIWLQTFFDTLASSEPVQLRSAGILLVLAVLAALATRTLLPRLWSVLAGAQAVAAAALAVSAIELGPPMDDVWLIAAIAAGAAAVPAVLAVLPLPRFIRRVPLLLGAWLAVLLPMATATPLVLIGTAWSDGASGDQGMIAWTVALVALGAGTAVLWARGRRAPETERLARWALGVGLWVLAAAMLHLVLWRGPVDAARAAIGLGLAVLVAVALVLAPRVRRAPPVMRAPLIAAAHALPVVVALLAWPDRALLVPVGVAVVATWAVVAWSMPTVARPVHVVTGYAYALAVLAAALDRAGVEPITTLCLTSSAASVVALAVTLVPRIPQRHWWSVLGVTSVPFLIGVGSVIAVRSGWTGLSTAVTFALALTLLLTRRPGMTTVLRAAAAALLVPALAVVVICLGAEWLATSASPVTLPIIAVIVAVAVSLLAVIHGGLLRLGLPAADAAAARLAIELSTLLTEAIAVVLALVRDAAGFGTTFAVLMILGLGFAGMALFARRRLLGWVLSFSSFTGALWSFLALSRVELVEPYVLPPSLTAAVIAVIILVRSSRLADRAVVLFWISIGIAPLPTLGMLAVYGTQPGAGAGWRTPSLLIASAALIGLAVLAGRLPRRLARARRTRVPLLVTGMVAAAAGTVQGVRFGWRLDDWSGADDRVMAPILGLAVPAALLAAVAGRLLADLLAPAADGPGRRGGFAERWFFLPALVLLVAGPITGIRRDWFAIWTLWGLALALLLLMVAIAVISRRRPVVLPPVWAVFAIAWCTAVAGWSARDLRVEAFSLPLGLALLAAGVVGMGAVDDRVPARATLTSWPVRHDGSWRLLAPGIVATLLPSMLATGTDPQTWRAITVLALALIAILIGSLRKLAAPFILGIVALPIENVIVFAVQLGTSISATSWWITLATAGAVLLVIATTWERRSGGERGIGARMRDLT